MPTSLPISHYRPRAAVYANDFRTVATFSAIGLLVGVLAMIFGVQGASM